MCSVPGGSHQQYEEKILQHEESVQRKNGTSVVEIQGKKKGTSVVERQCVRCEEKVCSMRNATSAIRREKVCSTKRKLCSVKRSWSSLRKSVQYQKSYIYSKRTVCVVGRESLHYLEFHICSASRESVHYQKGGNTTRVASAV